jgi:hypothetical protein
MTEYHIETVNDFLMVPKDRRAACLVEFLEWIAIADELPKLIASYGPETEAFRFDWIDDGKADVTVEFVPSVCAIGEDGD